MALLVFGLLMAAPLARAQVAPDPDLSLAPAIDGKLRWKPAWPRFRPIEYAATGAMLTGTIVLALEDRYRDTGWRGGILFDYSVRDWLLAHSESGRRRAHDIGTYLYMGSFGFSVADAVLSAWVIRGSADVMSQMLLIDTEVYALVGLLQFTAAATIRRERPYERECRKGRDQGFPGCSERNADGSKGFFAGHTAIASANAALTCAHHRALRLYGTAGDASVCGLTVASALVVAYTRIAADKHYATDDLVGLAIGGSAGALIPALLHYRNRPPASAGSASAVQLAAVLPLVTPTSLSLNVAASF